MDFKIIDIINHRHDFILLNPSQETPFLLDDIDRNNNKKDLKLSNAQIICEYIDERFPHPQFMPIEPSEKARLRMTMHQLDQQFTPHIRLLDNANNKEFIKLNKKKIDQAKTQVIQLIDTVSQVFTANKRTEFLFGNSFSLLDAAILPLLWRLNYYHITNKPSWSGMMKYATRNFKTTEFIASLTPAERSMQHD